MSAPFDEGELIEASMEPWSAPTEPSPTEGPSRPRRRRTWPGVLASYLAMIFLLLTLNFMLPRAMPGDPITALVARGSGSFTYGEESKQKLEDYYNLDGSLMSQYGDYFSRLAHGDFGTSIATNQSVAHDIAKALPWTILLIGSSLLFSTVIGCVLGIHIGWRRDRPADRALMTGLLSVREFPPYLLGSLLLFGFAVKLGWFPLGLAETPFSSDYTFFQRVSDIVSHAFLPVVVLTSGLTVGYYLVMRGGMVSELGSSYLQMGRAKGLRDRRLKYRYAARNALLPVVSLTTIEIGFAVTANIAIERIFSYPGLGRLMFESVPARDYPVMQGTFLVFSVGIVTINALADAFYRRIDPRAAV